MCPRYSPSRLAVALRQTAATTTWNRPVCPRYSPSRLVVALRQTAATTTWYRPVCPRYSPSRLEVALRLNAATTLLVSTSVSSIFPRQTCSRTQTECGNYTFGIDQCVLDIPQSAVQVGDIAVWTSFQEFELVFGGPDPGAIGGPNERISISNNSVPNFGQGNEMASLCPVRVSKSWSGSIAKSEHMVMGKDIDTH